MEKHVGFNFFMGYEMKDIRMGEESYEFRIRNSGQPAQAHLPKLHDARATNGLLKHNSSLWNESG